MSQLLEPLLLAAAARGPGIRCGLSLFLVLVPVLWVFFSVSTVFLPPPKPTFQNPIPLGNCGEEVSLRGMSTAKSHSYYNC